MKRYLLGEGKTVVKSRTGESEWLKRNSYPKVGQGMGKGKERRELGHDRAGQSGNVTCAGCKVLEPIMRASEVRRSGSVGGEWGGAKEGRKVKAEGKRRGEVGGRGRDRPVCYILPLLE